MRAQSLIVSHPFAGYSKGQEIFDTSEIEKILQGENSNYFIKSSYEKYEEVDNLAKIEVITENKVIEVSVKTEGFGSDIKSKESKANITKSK